MPDASGTERSDGAAGIRVEVSPDAMEARIVGPADGSMTAKLVKEALDARNIVSGIRDDVIAAFDSDAPPEGKVLVAEGTRPVHGTDGAIDYAVGATTPSPVEKDAVIGTVTPPVKGADGMSVFGTAVPARDPEPVAMPERTNVAVTGNGTKLTATIGGYVFIDSFGVRVRPFFEIEITPDKYEARVTAAGRLNDDDFGPDDLRAFLAEKGVTHGIDETMVDGIFSDGLHERQVVIARGVPVVNGADGTIRYFFDPETRPEIDDSRNINFKELNLIRNVSAGEKLAEIVPPVPGESGMNVFGETVQPIEGKPASFAAGKNTKPDPANADALIADIDGSVKLTNGRIEVDDVYVVQKNVDYSTGNITFVGDVIVKGDVLSGFRIKANGNVQVEGVIEDAVIESRGSVLVRKGFIGHGGGRIMAKGDVSLTFCENEHIIAEGEVTIGSYAMNSTIETRASIIADQNRGLLVGGDYYAVKAINVNTIGSPHGTRTKCHAGMDMVTRAHLKLTEESIREIDLLLLKHERRKLLKKDPSERLKDLLANLHHLHEQLEKKRDELAAEINALPERGDEFKMGLITAHKTVHTGVVIGVYDQWLTVQEKHAGATFRYTDDGVMCDASSE